MYIRQAISQLYLSLMVRSSCAPVVDCAVFVASSKLKALVSLQQLQP